MNKKLSAFVGNKQELINRCNDLQRENHRLKTENLELLNHLYELLGDNRRLRKLLMIGAKRI